MSLLAAGVVAGGLKILAKVIDQKINEWNLEAKRAKPRIDQMHVPTAENSHSGGTGKHSSRLKGRLNALLAGQKHEIGIVLKRGRGWTVELNANCRLNSQDMYCPRWSMHGVIVTEDGLNNAYPYVEFPNGDKTPVCVRYNVFGDYKFYCENK